jgi:hypothetical protein
MNKPRLQTLLGLAITFSGAALGAHDLSLWMRYSAL